MSGRQIATDSVEGVTVAPDFRGSEGVDDRGADGGDALQDARARIRAIVSIASGHGSSVSTEEIHLLLPAGAFENPEAVERFVARDEVLRTELGVQRGEIFSRPDANAAKRRGAQRALTADRLRLAEAFASRLVRRCPGVRLVAVSGSTAFGAAEPDHDVDFFVVTGRSRMWITLLLSMTMARIDRLRDARTPTLCFNRVVETEPCVTSFSCPGDPLLAREALSLKVVHGRGFYRKLLRDAAWMERFFPNLYRASLLACEAGAEPLEPRGSAAGSFANLAAYLSLAPYLWLAGLVRNVRLRRQGRPDALFRTVVGFRFFSYESRKFEVLRERYAREF